MPGATSRWALPYPLSTDLISAGDDTIHDLATALDDVVKLSTGTFAARPTQPVTQGRVYLSTDIPQLDISDGTNWRPLWPVADGAITTVKLAANAVTAAKIEAQQAWQTASFTNTGGTITASNSGDGDNIEYYKDSLGIVHIRPKLYSCSATVGGTYFTLPSGFRPGKLSTFALTASNPIGGVSFVAVGTNGAAAQSLGVPGSGFCTFAAVTFRAEN